jgi:DNA-binding transcriptional regulator YdaS (Cro superfamily)
MAEPLDILNASQRATSQFFQGLANNVIAVGNAENQALSNALGVTKLAADIDLNNRRLKEEIRFNTARIASTTLRDKIFEESANLDKKRFGLSLYEAQRRALKEDIDLELQINALETNTDLNEAAIRAVAPDSNPDDILGVFDKAADRTREVIEKVKKRRRANPDLSEIEIDAIDNFDTSQLGLDLLDDQDLRRATRQPDPRGLLGPSEEQVRNTINQVEAEGLNQLPPPSGVSDASIILVGGEVASPSGIDFVGPPAPDRPADTSPGTLSQEVFRLKALESLPISPFLKEALKRKVIETSEPIKQEAFDILSSIASNPAAVSQTAGEDLERVGVPGTEATAIARAVNSRNAINSEISELVERRDKLSQIVSVAATDPNISTEAQEKEIEDVNKQIQDKRNLRNASDIRINEILNRYKPKSVKQLEPPEPPPAKKIHGAVSEVSQGLKRFQIFGEKEGRLATATQIFGELEKTIQKDPVTSILGFPLNQNDIKIEKEGAGLFGTSPTVVVTDTGKKKLFSHFRDRIKKIRSRGGGIDANLIPNVTGPAERIAVVSALNSITDNLPEYVRNRREKLSSLYQFFGVSPGQVVPAMGEMRRLSEIAAEIGAVPPILQELERRPSLPPEASGKARFEKMDQKKRDELLAEVESLYHIALFQNGKFARYSNIANETAIEIAE